MQPWKFLFFEGFEIKNSTRIKRLHSERAGLGRGVHSPILREVPLEPPQHTTSSPLGTTRKPTELQRVRGSDQDLGFKMPERIRTTKGVWDILCPICCAESNLFSPSTQAAFTTVWVSNDSNGARPQGHQAHATQVHCRTTSLLGPPTKPSVLSTVS